MALLAGSLLAGCGAHANRPAAEGPIPPALLAGARTIGPGPRFVPPVTGHVAGDCRRSLGPRIAAHVELFADNHVILIPAGIGTRPPRTVAAARIVRAGCFGAVVTLDPTGVVFVRRGSRPPLSELFRAWGEPLSSTRIASFRAVPGSHVSVFVDGRAWHAGSPGQVHLTEHAEIVLEVGPHVPPHTRYTYPPLPSPSMR